MNGDGGEPVQPGFGRLGGLAALRAVRRVAPAARLPLLTTVILLASTPLLVGHLQAEPVVKAQGLLGLAVLLAAFALSESVQVHLELRKQTLSMSLAEIPLVIGLLAFTPPQILFAGLVGRLALIGWRRRPLSKSLFNLACYCLEVGVAVALFSAVRGAADVGPQMWFGAYLAVLIADLTVTGCVVLAVTALQKPPTRADLATFLLTVVCTALLTTTMSLLSWIAVRNDARAAGLLVVVVAVAVLAYREFASLSGRHRDLGELHRSVQAVTSAQSGASLIEAILEESRRLTRADRAVLYLRGDSRVQPPRAAVRRFELVAEDGLSVADVAELSPVLGDLLAGGSARVIVGKAAAEVHPGSVEPTTVSDVALIPLTSAGRVLGVLLMADRLGDMTTFGPDDLALLTSLGASAATALANGRLLRRLEHAAEHDALTGLSNRAGFTRHLLQQIERSSAASPAAVVLIDLDGFEDVDGGLGQDVWDQLLISVAARTRRVAGDSVCAARLESNEFAVLLAPGGPAPFAVALDLLAAIGRPFDIHGLRVEVGATAGVALSPDHGEDAVTLLRRARVAVRAARAAREPVRAYSARLDVTSARRRALLGELRAAISGGRLVVHYQPKVSLAAGELVGVEALVRWEHPEEGLISPDEFIPLAERAGLIGELTDVVLCAALEQCRAWRSAGREITVAVNLSVSSLSDAALPDRVSAVLARLRLPAEVLTLEITESEVIQDLPATLPVLEELARRGVQLSLDDFGTGYSSLVHLRRLPITEVKIDKSFVLNLGTDAADAAIVASIVELAGHLGLRVVAEGVEDERARDLLKGMGCDVIQGYLISRPTGVARFEAWMASRTVPVQPGTMRAGRRLRVVA